MSNAINNSLLGMPVEVQSEIFEGLSPNDRAALVSTCRKMHQMKIEILLHNQQKLVATKVWLGRQLRKLNTRFHCSGVIFGILFVSSFGLHTSGHIMQNPTVVYLGAAGVVGSALGYAWHMKRLFDQLEASPATVRLSLQNHTITPDDLTDVKSKKNN